MADHDDHRHGLEFDLQALSQQLYHRRGMLGLLGGGAAALATSTALGADALCIPDAQETNGPFPADGSNRAPGGTSTILTERGVVRSDIRSSFGTSTSTAAGVPLTLKIKVGDADKACAALPGYVVYVWHCTQDGLYSLYTAPNENYLRGVQEADANGGVTFTTIFPGCYPGRWPHIHFEIYPSLVAATDHKNAVLTSQFAMPGEICGAAYKTAGYEGSAKAFPDITIASDMVFADNSADQMAMMTPSFAGSPTEGYVATVTVGIAV